LIANSKLYRLEEIDNTLNFAFEKEVSVNVNFAIVTFFSLIQNWKIFFRFFGWAKGVVIKKASSFANITFRSNRLDICNGDPKE
jgi:hypothetical protein